MENTSRFSLSIISNLLPPTRPSTSSSSSSHKMATTLLVILCLCCITITHVSAKTQKQDTFTPQDNYLIDCGSPTDTPLPDKRLFVSDQGGNKFLATKSRDIQVSAPEGADVPLPIYQSARVFVDVAEYTFQMARPGWHWIRLHFFPVQINEFNLQNAKFTVETDSLVLIRDLHVKGSWSVQEFLVNVTTERFPIKFFPTAGSFAYINAIELVSAPDILINDIGTSLSPVGPFSGLSNLAYQTSYRINMGGAPITPQNDTLGRTWEDDTPFLKPESSSSKASVNPNVIIYPDGTSPLIAPPAVYASATQMANANVSVQTFNVTWTFDVDASFSYLVRMHFCDIVSKALNDLYFNVYINGKMGISSLDLTAITGDLASAYYKDFVVNSSVMANPLVIQVGPLNQDTGAQNAILNGLEVLKMNNSIGSLDGEYGAGGKSAEGPNRGTIAAVGFAMMFGAFVGLGAMAVKWRKRPQDWQRRNSFSSWLLPVHAGDSTFMSSKGSASSRKSQMLSSTMGLGRYFSFNELTDATKNWDSNAIIGVGGFGNVYVGVIDDGTKVAVKRGNPQSEQGIHEFQTEIQMLSKLRHRHLVSLIGYCDENSEMILVYEFMANGPLRDHLYGKDMPAMSWKQRLEICIGSARGLHYLHTGASQGIIHRDVKTTNILLDENFVAKMADFGLSKDAPNSEQNHVSTAVKGSFGYLDPEYFRKQQLTDKSDVYSFGVVLFEALCARPAINPSLPREQVNLAEWALQWKRKGLLEKIVDPTLAGKINPESMNKFAEAAEKCLAEYGVDRPTMGDVLWNLEYALQLQEASLQGKMEEEEKELEGTVSPATVPNNSAASPATPAVSTPDAQGVNDHSTAMFNQFGSLNGR